jgi:hypothetical protein
MWLAAKCPVRAKEQAWIEQSMRWFIGQFGDGVLRRPVVLPTDEFFPGRYTGSFDDVRGVLTRICAHMAVDTGHLDLEFVEDDDRELLAHLPAYHSSYSGEAGHYQRKNGRAVISVSGDQARDPVALVATIAHEVSHDRLLGENRITPDRADHEPLTDLATVFFGLGIFSANSAAVFNQGPRGWQARRLGYLTEPMFGYALAYYAWLRTEPRPVWSRYLDTNPQAFLKKGLRYLGESGPAKS